MPELDQQVVQKLADEAFGRWAMVRASEEWLSTCGITHEPTLRFLREVGLPVRGSIYDNGTLLTRPAEVVDGFVDIGFSANCEIIRVNRETGAVYGFWISDAPCLYSSSVAHLVYFAAYWEVHAKVDGVWLDELDPPEDDEDLPYNLAEAMGRHFAEMDPAANAKADGEEEGLWEYIVSDGFAAGLYSEWTWDGDSVRYFEACGINPLAMTPRHELSDHVPNPWAR